MKRVQLVRLVSDDPDDLGTVAEGVVFSSGLCVLQWACASRGVHVYEDVGDAMTALCSEGTELVYLD